MLNHLREHPVPLSVTFADLNGLKYLNITYGHEIYGDQALPASGRGKHGVFCKDQLYRVSGDEFVSNLSGNPGRGIYQAGQSF